jgi:VWFA-related protein
MTPMVQSNVSNMQRHTFLLSVLVALTLTSAPTAQQPTFRSGVDLIRLDVHVVGDDGTPVRDLTESDFDVKVNGKPAPVRAMQFLDFTRTERTASEEARYRDVSSNQESLRGRLTILVIDESSLPEDTRPLMNSLAKYLKTLGPDDLTALIALPRPGLWHDFTRNTAELEALLLRTSSRNPLDTPTPFPIGAGPTSGSVAMDRGEVAVPTGSNQKVPTWLTGDIGERRDIIYALETLARRLKTVAGPKTLILISSALPATLDDFRNVAEAAAEARLTYYILKPHMFVSSAAGNVSAITQPFEETGGIDMLAGLTGGVVLNAVARATGVIERIGRETSGSYVIGVEPPQGVARDKPLDVTVKVKRDGLTVRSPKQVVAPAAGSTKPPKNAKGALGEVLRDPRLAADVPLRVTSYTAQGAEPSKVKTVIVAQVDEPSGDARDLSWGFEVHDGDRIIADAFEKTKVKDAASGVLVTSASLPPGAYTLRFATLDDKGRRASVDHPLVTDLQQFSGLKLSDVFVGEAVDGHFQPRIALDASVQQLVMFVEVYGKESKDFDNVSVEFALRGMDGANRGAVRTKAKAVPGSNKAMVQGALPLAHVGPGLYEVTATVLAGRQPLGAVEREIIIGQER